MDRKNKLQDNIRDGELDGLMDLAKTLKVLEVFIFDVIPTGRLSEQRECVLDESEADGKCQEKAPTAIF